MLPYLRHVRVCGGSALLWAAPSATSPDFLTDTPLLRKASFSQQDELDQEAAFDRGEDGSVPASQRLSADVLSTFLRSTVHLTVLNLANTNVTTEMLLTALPYASSALTTLSVAGTEAATDALVDRLHALVPALTLLDVRHAGWPLLTLPALARLASRLLRASPLPRWLGSFALTLYVDGPFSNVPSSPTLGTLTSELRTALAVLSPTQLALLAQSAPALNDPPNALPFVVVRQEVLALAGVNVLPAGQALVDAARAALGRWQRRREDEWALAWCRENDIEMLLDDEGIEDDWEDEEGDDREE